MTTEVEPIPVAMLVDLVNGWGTVPRARAADRPRPPVGDLVARHPVGGGLADGCGDAALERVADALYPVFAAEDAAERARLVTGVLATTRIAPALSGDADRLRATWRIPRERDALLAAAAIALHGQLAAHDGERLGTCASTSCADVFVDASPGAHRRFCSVTCQNRERVAAFRRRRRAAAAK